jgi:hypothetical protein
MKKILIIALLFITANLFSQVWVGSVIQNDGKLGIGWSCTDIDSVDLVTGTVSPKFDWSFMSTTVYYNATLKSSTADTVRCIFKGYDPISGNYMAIDTISSIISSTDGGTSFNGTLSIPLLGIFPEITVTVQQHSSLTDPPADNVFELFLFSVPASLPANEGWKSKSRP